MKKLRNAISGLLGGAFLAALCIGAQANATTVVFNGDTPAHRFQRIADRAHVPTWQGTVHVFARRCPDIPTGEWEACVVTATAADIPRVFVRRGNRSEYNEVAAANRFRYTRFVFLRQLGEVYAKRSLTPEGRAAFARAWGRWDMSDYINMYASCGLFRRLGPEQLWFVGVTTTNMNAKRVRAACVAIRTGR